MNHKSKQSLGFTHRPLSSSFLGLPHRLLNVNHKKELLRGLWVGFRGLGQSKPFQTGFVVLRGMLVCLLRPGAPHHDKRKRPATRSTKRATERQRERATERPERQRERERERERNWHSAPAGKRAAQAVTAKAKKPRRAATATTKRCLAQTAAQKKPAASTTQRHLGATTERKLSGLWPKNASYGRVREDRARIEAVSSRQTRAEVCRSQEEHDWRGGARLLHRSATKSCWSLRG